MKLKYWRFLLVFFSFNVLYAQRTIEFSGITWWVKDSRDMTKGPGNNYWSDDKESVWVDAEGSLHLKIRKVRDKWFSAEVISVKPFGYGDYTFFLASNVEEYDPNIVVGLFIYENDRREIDIEFSQWGNTSDVFGSYTVQPAPYTQENHHRFSLGLNGTYSTHKFIWTEESVLFQSYHGHFQNLPHPDYFIEQWECKGDNIPLAVNEHLHLNFWLYTHNQENGFANPPINGEEAELVIKAVSTPFAFR